MSDKPGRPAPMTLQRVIELLDEARCVYFNQQDYEAADEFADAMTFLNAGPESGDAHATPMTGTAPEPAPALSPEDEALLSRLGLACDDDTVFQEISVRIRALSARCNELEKSPEVIAQLEDELKAAQTEKAMKEKPHIESPKCWCNPVLDYQDPETGNCVWIHRRPQ